MTCMKFEIGERVISLGNGIGAIVDGYMTTGCVPAYLIDFGGGKVVWDLEDKLMHTITQEIINACKKLIKVNDRVKVVRVLGGKGAHGSWREFVGKVGVVASAKRGANSTILDYYDVTFPGFEVMGEPRLFRFFSSELEITITQEIINDSRHAV